jgi:nucleoside-diphosphate-sugar epimerase
VTGSAGFLGRHFSEELKSRGWNVVEIDILAQGDCRVMFRATDRFDLVVHCAAIVGGREAIEGEPLALSVNLDLDSAMFRWAARTKQGRVVYISSSAAYPVEIQTSLSCGRLSEDDLRLVLGDDTREYDFGMPDSVYGWTKLTGELLSGYAREAGAKVTVIRPFSGYGEDQAPSYPFRAMAERAKARRDPFEIWGQGSQVRDFIHVSDIVGATLALVENDLDGPVNLSTGRATSMLELAKMFCAEAGYSPEFALLGDKPQGVAYRVGSNDLMSQVWEPKVSLEEGIRRALAT